MASKNTPTNGSSYTVTKVGATGLTVTGGNGIDSINVANADIATAYAIATGTITLIGGNGADTVQGGYRAEQIWGDSNGNSDTGDNGADILRGGGGNDVIHGGNGADKVYGENDDDTLYGDNGDDLIDGGDGADNSYGGRGGDRFDFNTVTDSDATAGGFYIATTGDWVHDFETGQDKLDLTDIPLSKVGAPPELQYTAGASAWGVWQGTQGTYGNIVYADTNGDSIADVAIRVAGLSYGDFLGINIGPTITAADGLGAVTEDTATPNLTDTGVITFGDLDLTDSHTASAKAVSNALGGTMTATVTDNGLGDGAGSLHWDYSVANSATQYLAKGETTTETFTVTIDDGHGGHVDQGVTVTVTGVNDDVVITSDPQSDGASEDADGALGENTEDHTVSGAITYTDADTIDTHTASAAPEDTGYVGTFTIDDSAIDSGNSVGWSFTVNDGDLDYLQAGEHLIQKYDVTIDDGQGSAVVETVTIDLVGKNDVATFSGGDTGSVTEDGTLSAGGDLDVSDDDHDESSFQAAAPADLSGDYGTFTFNEADGTWTYLLDNDNATVQALDADSLPLTDTLTVTSADGTTHDIVVTINGADEAPVGPILPTGYEGGDDPNDHDTDTGVQHTTAGLSGDDVLVGDGLANNLHGGASNDTLFGAGGDDTLDGNSGNDVIYGQPGADVLNGGPQDDTIYGGDGNDTLDGDVGVDTLYGGSNDDILTGGGGNDILIGGYGADTLTGNGGNDTFRYLSILDTNDTITDYAAGDILDFQGIDANSSTGANDAFLWGGQDAGVQANSLTWYFDGVNTIIQGDTDGNTATAEIVVTVNGNHAFGVLPSDPHPEFML